MGFTYLQEVVFYLGENSALERLNDELDRIESERNYLIKVKELIKQNKNYEEISKELGDYPSK